MTEAKYRVGMIGIGRKGAQHARAYRINPRTQIVAAADTDEENLEVFCKRFGVPGYADYHEMLKKESIDIAAPILPVGPNPSGRDRLRGGGREGNPVREAVRAVAQGGRRDGRGLPLQRGEDRSGRPQHQSPCLPRGGQDDRGGGDR